MARILFLAHRIPYPPNKGDKIRSWHFLRHLAESHEVALAAFVDDPDDMQHAVFLRDVCVECHLEPVARSPLQMRNLAALARGEPISVSHYRSAAMRRKVESFLAHGPDLVLAFSGAMAQYLPAGDRSHCVIDFADVDSDKWLQYARQCAAPMRWVYQREAQTLLAHERHAAAQARASLFVSEMEANLFRKVAPDAAAKVHAVRNGVDALYFSPDAAFPSPFAATARPLVFTGMMDYWANVDGARWFAEYVFPRIRDAVPEAEFWIVGAQPTAAVQALGARAGVRVTGRVPDVRPFLAHAAVVVAPLRIARGVQNKILEAMAMARPVVTTHAAADGVDGAVIGHELVAESEEQAFAAAVIRLLGAPAEAEAMGAQARARVLRDHDWAANLARLDEILELGPPRAAPVAKRAMVAP